MALFLVRAGSEAKGHMVAKRDRPTYRPTDQLNPWCLGTVRPCFVVVLG